MLSKIFLTLTVILAAFIYVRKGNNPGQPLLPPRVKTAKEPEVTENQSMSDYRFAAYSILIMMFGVGGLLYYINWQDDHTLVTVKLYRSGEPDPITYEVYKNQLLDHSFTTIDGIKVTIAASERMEVEGL